MRQLSLLLAVLVVLLLSLPGCVSKSPKRQGDEVLLMLRATAEQLEVWQAALDKFKEQYKINVIIQNEPYDSYFSKLQTMIAGNSAPDVVFMESTRFPEFVTKGALMNLDQFVKAEREVVATDFYPEAWKAYQYQGSTYGLPNDMAVLSVAYNVEAFELAMLQPPKESWTWADYLKTAKTLTADTDDDGRIDQWGTTVCPWWQVYVWQNGGELVDDVTNPRKSTLSTPAAQEALQFLADLNLKHKVAPSASLTESMGRVEGFFSNHVGMIYCGRWDLPEFKKLRDGRWNTTLLPKGKREANLGLGSGFCIVKDSPKAQNAWKLIMFLSMGDGQQELLEGGFHTPASQVLTNSQYFLGSSVGGAPAFVEGVKYAHPVPFTTRYTEIANIWDQEMQLLWSGQSTVQQVTAKIDERVNKVLSESQPATAWLRGLFPRS